MSAPYFNPSDPNAPIGSSADIQARVMMIIPRKWWTWQAPVLSWIIGGLSDVAAWCYSWFTYALAQSRIATSSGPFLDIIAYDFLGRFLLRQGVSDVLFRAQITSTILQERVTRNGMLQVLTNLLGIAPTIIEPWNPGDCGGWSGPNQIVGFGGYGKVGAWGSLQLPNQVFIRVSRSGLGPSGVPSANGWGGYAGGYYSSAYFTFNKFNPAKTGANITLSGSNLVATNSVAPGYAVAIGAFSASAGKFYAEFTFGAGSLSDAQQGFGICDASQTLNTWIGIDNNGVGAFLAGTALNIFYNGVQVATYSGYATFIGTTTFQIAYDIVNKLLWFNVNNVKWNGNVSNNPATGVGGYPFVLGSGIFPAISLHDASAACTANFGATAYHFTPPSGFVSSIGPGVIGNGAIEYAGSEIEEVGVTDAIIYYIITHTRPTDSIAWVFID